MKISKSFTVYSNLTWYFGTVWTKNIFIPFNICWNISLDSFDIIQPNQPIKIYVGMRKVLWQISRKVPLTECWNWCIPARVSSGWSEWMNFSKRKKIYATSPILGTFDSAAVDSAQLVNLPYKIFDLGLK